MNNYPNGKSAEDSYAINLESQRGETWEQNRGRRKRGPIKENLTRFLEKQPTRRTPQCRFSKRKRSQKKDCSKAGGKNHCGFTGAACISHRKNPLPKISGVKDVHVKGKHKVPSRGKEKLRGKKGRDEKSKLDRPLLG